MHISEPITVLTSLPILMFSIFCVIALQNKLFRVSFFFLALMSIFGTLYHLDNDLFYLVQKFGTMIAGGLFSASLAIAALHINYSISLARELSVFPLTLLIIYLLTIGSDSFLPFIILQAASILILFVAYSKQFPSRKTLFIYAAGLTFIAAGIIQAKSINFSIFDNNDLFHFVSFISIVLLYKGVRE